MRALILTLAALTASGGCASSKGRIDRANRASSEHAGAAIADIASADGKLEGAKNHADPKGVKLIGSAQGDLADAKDHLEEVQESSGDIAAALPGVKDKSRWWSSPITWLGLGAVAVFVARLLFTGSSITGGAVAVFGWLKGLRKRKGAG